MANMCNISFQQNGSPKSQVRKPKLPTVHILKAKILPLYHMCSSSIVNAYINAWKYHVTTLLVKLPSFTKVIKIPTPNHVIREILQNGHRFLLFDSPPNGSHLMTPCSTNLPTHKPFAMTRLRTGEAIDCYDPGARRNGPPERLPGRIAWEKEKYLHQMTWKGIC